MRRGFGEFVVLGTIALIVYLAADALGLFNTNISTNLPKPRYTPVFEPAIPNVPPLWAEAKTVVAVNKSNHTLSESIQNTVESSEVENMHSVTESGREYNVKTPVKGKEESSARIHSYLIYTVLQACKENQCSKDICDAAKDVREPLSVELHIGRWDDYWWRYNFGNIIIDERYVNNKRVLIVWYLKGGAAESCIIIG